MNELEDLKKNGDFHQHKIGLCHQTLGYFSSKRVDSTTESCMEPAKLEKEMRLNQSKQEMYSPASPDDQPGFVSTGLTSSIPPK